MRFKHVVVWGMISSLLVAQTATLAQTSVPSQSHDQGAAFAKDQNRLIRGMVNAPSASAHIPGYTTTPPETAYRGKPNLTAEGNARLSACASRPNDPTCQGLNAAATSANTPRPAISASDPSIAAANAIARRPETNLGSLSAFYSGCTTSDATTAAGMQLRSCNRYVGVGRYSCSNALTVAVERTHNCTPGDWFARSAADNVSLDAQCIPSRPDTHQHFRFAQNGGTLAFFDVDMTTTSLRPELSAKTSTNYDADGNPITTGVYVTGKSCTSTSCTLTAMLATDPLTLCDANDPLACTTVKPFVDVMSPCPGGSLSGDNLSIESCSGSGDGISCSSTTLDPNACYAPAAGVSTISAIDRTGTYGSFYWQLQSTRTQVGWAKNPAYGTIPTVALTYTKPEEVATFTDTWSNQCPALQAGDRCALTSAPRCIDGPSSKNIDGLSVTRDCWQYESTLSCAGTGSSDACAPLAAAGCLPVSSACAQSNAATGACEVYRDQYGCPTPSQTTTTATNCPKDVFCLGGGCFNISAAKDTDFGRSMSMLEAARESGIYLDTDNMLVFKGERDTCRSRTLTDCCMASPSGSRHGNNSYFSGASKLVFDFLMNADNREFVYDAIISMVESGAISGQVSLYGVTVTFPGAATGGMVPADSTVFQVGGNASAGAAEGAALADAGTMVEGAAVASEGTTVAVSWNPYVLIAMLIINAYINATECSENEYRLALQEGARVCHTVGEYCVAWFYCPSGPFGIPRRCGCRATQTGKCCFNSMLSRIINEQGRAQIGKGWGTPESQDCSGFTIAQLQTLDFGAMDFSEFYASLIPDTLTQQKALDNNAGKAASCYYGKGKC